MVSDTDTKSKEAPKRSLRGVVGEKRFFPLFQKINPVRQKKSSKKGKSTDSMDQRWSDSSEKMSSLTVRILSVNIIAIMILGLGILYLGQYTDSLIEGELESMRTEARFISAALSEGTVRPVFQMSRDPYEDPIEIEAVKPDLARRMVRRLGENGVSQIKLFSVDGTVLADTNLLIGSGGAGSVVHAEQLEAHTDEMSIGQLFDKSASRFLDIIPMQTNLEYFPSRQISDITSFVDSRKALHGQISAHAWKQPNGKIILTAAAPVQKIRQVLGVALLIRDGTDLENKIAEIRIDVFRVFLGSLGITVMLSIYLSGVISQPLKKLADAAEAVRLGKGRQMEIPDMTERGDEIGELSFVLREMTQALWNRMDTIERFAADVSHEIKNPLTSLKSAVETVSRVNDDESRKKLMDIVHHDIKRLDRLISDISSASRLDAELSRDEMDEVELRAMLEGLADAYKKPLDRAQQKDTSNKIVINIDNSKDFYILGNEERLGQVFGNLISNALSFSPSDKPIKINIDENDETYTIVIEDQGPGIPENKIGTIFERFYTERPNTESYGNHSGLGLSISKQIVEAHGGQIWAENKKDSGGNRMGAKFFVRLNKL